MLARGTQTIINGTGHGSAWSTTSRDYAHAAPQLAAVDLNNLVREVLGLYEGSTAKISLQLTASLPPVHGDATQLRGSSTICCAMPKTPWKDAATGHIRELSETAGSRCARLRITDNGPGFPGELLPRIFEPYVTAKARGTGLGLPIVKKSLMSTRAA